MDNTCSWRIENLTVGYSDETGKTVSTELWVVYQQKQVKQVTLERLLDKYQCSSISFFNFWGLEAAWNEVQKENTDFCKNPAVELSMFIFSVFGWKGLKHALEWQLHACLGGLIFYEVTFILTCMMRSASTHLMHHLLLGQKSNLSSEKSVVQNVMFKPLLFRSVSVETVLQGGTQIPER
jgi:hypothetical protein